ncbi:MAG: ATP-binding protein, partial [Eubacteriales bacterium]|nr:ATP-binding protein [Eubacteriales bacterium]
IGKYLVNFMHPIFEYKGNGFDKLQVTPCSLVSGNELAIHMGLPRKSVCGFPVIEHADFGKEVVSYDHDEPKNTINLGKVFNMGSETANTVKLSRESLSMHTFITGSTGSGKSNTVYELLRQLKYENVKFMVIEPAKGEYKNIFGNQSDVEVLGTNPEYSKLLKINPFKFPKGIHVLEHIDRLIEILNVCWPMYAAMPAILKEATLKAYEGCGWNLANSVNSNSNELFPTFADLLNELEVVIDDSTYSQEVKGNYIGSLVTRVKSLTNGLNGQIFSSNEFDNAKLFDENVIVDLSRVGSAETKSLIMGVLVMRLNEYRMSTATSMNQKLKHITVLEEAHNILKRTSTEQNPEAPSMGGKSVEMLSNSIAEMRTYGEGFIIADQSPNAVDISAIRNTNTKIILRLPDEADRRLAGKAAGLSDEQLAEIAKLPKGVAVVYQNDWIEPVLCKIKKCGLEESIYSFEKETAMTEDETKFRKELVALLLKGRTVERTEPDIEYIEGFISKSSISTKNKLGIYRLIDEYKETKELKAWEDNHFNELAEMVAELIAPKSVVTNIVNSKESIDEMNISLCELVNNQISDLSSELKLSVMQCLMRNYADSDEKVENYAFWKKYMVDGGVK